MLPKRTRIKARHLTVRGIHVANETSSSAKLGKPRDSAGGRIQPPRENHGCQRQGALSCLASATNDGGENEWRCSRRTVGGNGLCLRRQASMRRCFLIAGFPPWRLAPKRELLTDHFCLCLCSYECKAQKFSWAAGAKASIPARMEAEGLGGEASNSRLGHRPRQRIENRVATRVGWRF